ncbi:MAG: toll/interleukin-1 receptor domain-containing protein [Candidatus Limnocylindria bacterium]
MTLPDGSQDEAEPQRDTTRHVPGVPKHDMFVSYSTADKPVADAIVSRLEQAGIRCWIAPRDVIPGMVWAEAIIEAIDTSRLMVVVLSGAANQSNQVIREVERAVAHGAVVIPFRIESILPTGAMAYYLGSEHWLDALTPPLESHIASLVKASLALLERPVPTTQPVATASPAASAQSGGFSRAITRPVGLVAMGLGAIALSVAAVFIFSGRGAPQPSATATPSGSPSGTASGAESAAPSVSTELNLELAPTFDAADLTAGFTPDPYSADGRPGGEIDVSYLGAGCIGFASEAPDFDVTYTAGGADLLRFYFVAASSDTSMVVNAPDGSWYCSDDSDGSIDPMIDFASPAEGLYDIWIGNLDSGAFDDGTLYVTGDASQHP